MNSFHCFKINIQSFYSLVVKTVNFFDGVKFSLAAIISTLNLPSVCGSKVSRCCFRKRFHLHWCRDYVICLLLKLCNIALKLSNTFVCIFYPSHIKSSKIPIARFISRPSALLTLHRLPDTLKSHHQSNHE
ncbi:hypothetical protein D3C85_1432280 [compost metagenome]